MLSISKHRILFGNAHKLILLAISEAIEIRCVILGTEIVESVWIIDLWVLVFLGIM